MSLKWRMTAAARFASEMMHGRRPESGHGVYCHLSVSAMDVQEHWGGFLDPHRVALPEITWCGIRCRPLVGRIRNLYGTCASARRWPIEFSGRAVTGRLITPK